MPINSRAKGLRFERKMAKEFSKALDRDIVRVPASGGLEIRSDLYDPYDPNFNLFIECKSGYNFNIGSFTGKNDYMTKILDKEESLLVKVNENRREKGFIKQHLVVVFTSKVFDTPFAIIPLGFLISFQGYELTLLMEFNHGGNFYYILPLGDFLKRYTKN